MLNKKNSDSAHMGSTQHSRAQTHKQTQRQAQQQANLAAQGLTRAEVIATERQLAKFANMMDSAVRIPFTKQGLGADAALSSVPILGDLAGLALTGYAFILGKRLGVPSQKMTPAVRLAVLDMVVGVVPAVGTLMDIFIRPSRKTLEIVHQHLHDEYGITDTMHLERPFMQQSLERHQQKSNTGLWHNPVVAWLYLHIPDFLGLMLLLLIGWMLWAGISWLVAVFTQLSGFG